MRIIIAFESKYGNGKKAVDHLGSTLTKNGHSVDIFDMRKAEPGSLPEADIYVFSSPTHLGNAPFKVRGFLKNLKIPKGKAKYALMATYLYPRSKSLNTMNERIKDLGIPKAADDLLIKVTAVKGPLEEGYEEQVEAFASQLIKQ
jgi:flavorubredoxin